MKIKKTRDDSFIVAYNLNIGKDKLDFYDLKNEYKARKEDRFVPVDIVQFKIKDNWCMVEVVDIGGK